MISEDYDHRWEALAEIHFSLEDVITEDNYIYCLCSRVFIRDGVKLHYTEKENPSESDAEEQRDTTEQLDDQSHVHFSLDTSYKVKCEKDEGASCYCSASHTDNCCSTDEHDVALVTSSTSAFLQPSDSGADLTYHDGHTDSICLPTEFNENYCSENTWDKFWSINGERLIWASWIKKYSDYINPAYLDENNDLCLDENNVPTEHTDTKDMAVANTEDDIRERKFSYDSKVNPYKKNTANSQKSNKNTLDLENTKDDVWLPIGRQRSTSEHDRMLSPRTLATTDSMTHVTKITLSSCDVTSSCVTSESTPTEEYSVTSSTTDDPLNDQTRIANLNDNSDEIPLEDLDTETYWQVLWKKHFGEQYSIHYSNYLECHSRQSHESLSNISVEVDSNARNLGKIKERPQKAKSSAKTKKQVKDTKSLPSNVVVESLDANTNVATSFEDIKVEDNKCKQTPSMTNDTYNTHINLDMNNDNIKTTSVVEIKSEVKDSSFEDSDIQVSSSVMEVKSPLENIQISESAYVKVENAVENKDDPSVSEMERQVEDITIDDKESKPKKKKHSNSYYQSIGYLLKVLQENQSNKNSLEEVMEGSEENSNKNNNTAPETVDAAHKRFRLTNSDESSVSGAVFKFTGGGDDPPEEKPINLKRSHESEDSNELTEEEPIEDHEESDKEKIISTFDTMGLFIHPDSMPKGQLVYRKHNKRLRLPLPKRFGASKKTYFDDDGNPYEVDKTHGSQEEREMQTDDDCSKVKVDSENLTEENKVENVELSITKDNTVEVNAQLDVPIHAYLDTSNSDNQEGPETAELKSSDDGVLDTTVESCFVRFSEEGKTVCRNCVREVNSESSPTHPRQSIKKFTYKEGSCAFLQHHQDDQGGNIVKVFSQLLVARRRGRALFTMESEGRRPRQSTVIQKNVCDLPRRTLVKFSRHHQDDVGGYIIEDDVSDLEAKRKRRKKRRSTADLDVPVDVIVGGMTKYWKKRHSLFHRFDEGIKLDMESWFSVTPEEVAKRIAERCRCDVIVDGFCGAGGNSIQFAWVCERVIAIDIDPVKIEMARHNAAVYGVENRIEFIVGDFFQLAPTLKADVVFLSPPWGGPNYSKNVHYDLETMLVPKPSTQLMAAAESISKDIAIYVPRNSRIDQLVALAKTNGAVEIEQNFLNKRYVAITAYYGDLVN